MVTSVQKIFSNSTNVFMKKSFTEAATGGVLWKELFLKISQCSQENICVGISFLIKLLALLTNFIKKRLTTTKVLSCGYCEIPKNTYFEEHLWTAVFALNTVFCKYKNYLNIKKPLNVKKSLNIKMSLNIKKSLNIKMYLNIKMPLNTKTWILHHMNNHNPFSFCNSIKCNSDDKL